MNLTIGDLRLMIRNIIAEAAARATKPQPYVRNALSPASVDRDQLSRVSIKDVDVDELSPHLRDIDVTPEECFGPVPPTQGDPYVSQDMFVRDSSPLPTPPIKR